MSELDVCFRYEICRRGTLTSPTCSTLYRIIPEAFLYPNKVETAEDLQAVNLHGLVKKSVRHFSRLSFCSMLLSSQHFFSIIFE